MFDSQPLGYRGAMGSLTVLVLDDEPAVAKVLGALLAQAGYRVVVETDGERALARVGAERVDAVLTDLRMPGMDGLTVLGRCRRLQPDLPVVILTAHATVSSAIEALRAGATDFMLKPVDRDELLYTMSKALSRRPCWGSSSGQPLLGESAAMQELRELITKAGRSPATVLIRGETGTGKELTAAAVHQASDRRDGPFIALNCAALPDALLESELFGYEKGAFTGAVQQKPGRVELAQGGTLFLDEVAEMSPALQAKLLRLLQNKEITRLGGSEAIAVNVRFVAATHQDLTRAITEGTFREDLYYRLSVIPLTTPPLRERRSDIPLLARSFAGAARPIDDEACAKLSQLDWPGNVRQLQNFVERLLAMSDDPTISASDVERELQRDIRLRPVEGGLEAVRRNAEKARILEAIEQAGGNRSLAARLLGLSRRTFYNKLDQLEISSLPPPSNAPR